MIQTLIHYFLHLGFPLIIAWVFFREDYKRAYLVMLVTMLVDVDHLLASPIFEADRCSINFHPLHTYAAMLLYVGLLFLKKSYRWIGAGLLWHMATDLNDCVLTYLKCPECLAGAPALGLVSKLAELIGR